MLLAPVLVLFAAPPAPPIPPAAEQLSALFGTWESGRAPAGGIYAWFAVAAPPAAVYSVLADDGAMRTWIPHLSESTVLDAAAVCPRVGFAVPSPIGSVTYELARCRDGSSVWWTKAAGDRFETIEGSYLLAEVQGGTLVRYWSHVVANVPVSEGIQAQIARIGLGDLVDGLRREVAARH